jgi:hypothetical protein
MRFKPAKVNVVEIVLRTTVGATNVNEGSVATEEIVAPLSA